MEVVTGALPCLLLKLADLLIGEYNLQKEVRGGIIFLQAELESMKVALDKISETPADKLDKQDKIWARDVRELSYDIEDKIDTFMVFYKSSRLVEQHGLKKAINTSLDWLTRPKIRHKIAIDIRKIRIRVEEVSKRRDRYKVNGEVAKPVRVDYRFLAQYERATELIGIDEARDELIKMMESNHVSTQQQNIISIVGIGGLGKTALANVVYQNLRAQFDCSAFVSVSQTPNMVKLFNNLLYQLDKRNNASINVLIDELRKILGEKRYEPVKVY